jgi:hypothetical protein
VSIVESTSARRRSGSRRDNQRHRRTSSSCRQRAGLKRAQFSNRSAAPRNDHPLARSDLFDDVTCGMAQFLERDPFHEVEYTQL